MSEFDDDIIEQKGSAGIPRGRESPTCKTCGQMCSHYDYAGTGALIGWSGLPHKCDPRKLSAMQDRDYL